MNLAIRRSRISSVAVALALFVTGASSARTSPAALFSASQAAEPVKMIALVNPGFPRVLVAEQLSLGADVNAERVKRGLPALVIDETLNRFALAKCIEMASRGYFGHTSPDGVTFEDRLQTWHMSRWWAAENIAFDRDEPHAHAAFMNSAPHAANLLGTHELRMGVAAVTVNKYETFYVEDFSG